MRTTLMMTAALLLAPAAFAQTTGGASVATPAPVVGQAPPEAMKPGMMPMKSGEMPMMKSGEMPMTSGEMPMKHMSRAEMQKMHGRMGQSADIRPGHEPGVGDSFPASDNASNMSASDTRSPIAPRLPVPMGGQNATPATLLADAQKALDSRQSGRAQEALERAETAMLQRSVPADQASMPAQSGGVTQIQAARAALAKGDMAGAKKAIAAAMTAG